MYINGKCHCANISFQLEWPDDSPAIAARVCDCSFCVRHGGVWTSHPRSRLAVTLADGTLVSRYTFGTGTATFHVCSRCGSVPFVTSEIEGHLYAVVNVNVFLDFDAVRLHRSPASFEGEEVASRLSRRKRNWVADVQISEAGR